VVKTINWYPLHSGSEGVTDTGRGSWRLEYFESTCEGYSMGVHEVVEFINK